MYSDKYKRSWSKYEIDNLGEFEKIYPTEMHWPIYMVIIDAIQKSLVEGTIEKDLVNKVLMPIQ